MDEIRIVDTTLRDGDISLWAYGMTTGMMLPALRHMDEAGFDSMDSAVKNQDFRSRAGTRDRENRIPRADTRRSAKTVRRRQFVG